MIWKILGIEKTKDEEGIKAAYRDRLRQVNPEDDEQGFKELRRAYEEAMEYAGLPEDVEEDSISEEDGRIKNEVDLWLDKVEDVYCNLKKRIDVKQWDVLFQDSVCQNLDTELEAAEKLLVFIMSHNYMPQQIWIRINKQFHYTENMEMLKEKFPVNFLNYVMWQIENKEFIKYEYFEGDTNNQVDEYIDILYEIRGLADQGNVEEAGRQLEKLKRYELSHPYGVVGEALYLLEKFKQEKDPACKEKALSLMEELDFEYGDDIYIERAYADCLVENDKVQKALDIYESLLEKSNTNPAALLGKSKCLYRMDKMEEAKDILEDILERDVQNELAYSLMDEINTKLEIRYKEQLDQQMDASIAYQLCWCYYQQKKFEEGIRLLDEIDEKPEDYDYINIRCRLYLANEDYEKAYPLAKQWLHLIESVKEDGSRETQKKKNRISLAHFSLGVCAWEIDYKNALDREKKEEAYQICESYFKLAVEEEKNNLVALSYKEQLARFYLEDQQYDLCIETCTDMIKEDAGFFPAYVHRQKAYSKLKNGRGVVDDFFAMKEIYSGYVPSYVLAAEVFSDYNQYDDVEKILKEAENVGIKSDRLALFEVHILHYREFSKENTKKALERMEQLRKRVYQEGRNLEDGADFEEFWDLEEEYASLYWDLDDVQKTLQIIDDYLEKDPENMNMLRLKVRVLNHERPSDEAIELGKKLVALDPSNLYNRRELGNGYEKIRAYDKAIEVYRGILRDDENDAASIQRLMYIFSYLSNQNDNLEQCRTGIEYATRLIEVTGNARGYVERGNLLIDLYELEQAVEDCRQAIRLDPNAFYAYNNLGCALLKLRKVDEAIEVLEQAIEMEPDYDCIVYVNLAECYVLKKRYKEAIEQYEKAMELSPNRVLYRSDQADVYEWMGQYQRAIELKLNIPDDLAKIREWKKTDDIYLQWVIRSYCEVIKLYAAMGDYKSGNRYVEKAMKCLKRYKGDSFPGRIDSIIDYFRDQGEYKVAEKYAKKLLKIAKNRSYSDKEILFEYATVLFELGKTKDAKKCGERYLEQLFMEDGSEEKLFQDKRYIPMHAYNLAIIYICMGEREKAVSYLSRIPDCKQCVMCQYNECFEYYFAMGLLAELNERYEEAKTLYEKAIEIRGVSGCAKNHLTKVNKLLSCRKND